MYMYLIAVPLFLAEYYLSRKDTFARFSPIFHKRGDFYDFLFAFLYRKLFRKWEK